MSTRDDTVAKVRIKEGRIIFNKAGLSAPGDQHCTELIFIMKYGLKNPSIQANDGAHNYSPLILLVRDKTLYPFDPLINNRVFVCL